MPPERVAPLFAAFNTAYVTSDKDLRRYPGLEPCCTPQSPIDAYVYRVAGVAPRAYVPAEMRAGRPRRGRHRLPAHAPPRRRRASRSAPPTCPLGGIPERMRGTVALTGYRAEEVELDATMDTAGLVVLTDTFYPGWQADVDGAPTPIVRANYFARGVFVDRGTHHIVFRYRPNSHRAGVSAVGAGAAGRRCVADRASGSRRALSERAGRAPGPCHRRRASPPPLARTPI